MTLRRLPQLLVAVSLGIPAVTWSGCGDDGGSEAKPGIEQSVDEAKQQIEEGKVEVKRGLEDAKDQAKQSIADAEEKARTQHRESDR